MKCENCNFFRLNFDKIKEMQKENHFGFFIGDRVGLKDGCFSYSNGEKIPEYMRRCDMYIHEFKGNVAMIKYSNFTTVTHPMMIGDLVRLDDVK